MSGQTTEVSPELKDALRDLMRGYGSALPLRAVANNERRLDRAIRCVHWGLLTTAIAADGYSLLLKPTDEGLRILAGAET